MRKVSIILGVPLIVGFVLFFYRDAIIGHLLFSPQEPRGTTPGVERDTREVDIEVVAEGLNIPWDIAFLPEGDLLVTERPGTLLFLSDDGNVRYEIEGVAHRGEGGLLGLALHPDFEENSYLYLYFTTDTEGGTTNRIERYRFDGEQLSDRTPILSRIPGASYHDGGRIAFGPDGLLYVTTGDAGNTELAQDTDSLAGKILRIGDDGSIPSDNPFGNEIYSYGHRNPQGLAWDRNGRLWITEHGPSGTASGNDEINLIEKGKNYGWPEIVGEETKEGMENPVLQSGDDYTWAPSSAQFLNDSIFFGGLRGAALFEARLAGGSVSELRTHFLNEYGRIRDVILGPDGYLYFTTSNTDGRGDPKASDDRIIRVNPALFSE